MQTPIVEGIEKLMLPSSRRWTRSQGLSSRSSNSNEPVGLPHAEVSQHQVHTL